MASASTRRSALSGTALSSTTKSETGDAAAGAHRMQHTGGQ